MERINFYNLIIIDQSGSMYSIYDSTLSTINETLQSIRNTQKESPEINQIVSIVTFSGEGFHNIRTVRNMVPVSEIEDLTKSDYCPNGNTPLYDAIGQSVYSLSGAISKESVVMVTIITDGYENSSKEYSALSVSTLIDVLRKYGWTFAFIGANQDATLSARELNISNAMDFEATDRGVKRMGDRYRTALDKISKRILWKVENNDVDSLYSDDMQDVFDNS